MSCPQLAQEVGFLLPGPALGPVLIYVTSFVETHRRFAEIVIFAWMSKKNNHRFQESTHSGEAAFAGVSFT
jgi:hypothetical protein